MRRAIIGALVIGLCFASTARTQTVSDQETPVSEMARRVLPSIVLLSGEDAKGQSVSPGRGFFVAKGVIATDYRVIKDSIRIYAKAPEQEPAEVTVVGVDAQRAVALLQMSGAKVEPLLIGNGQQVAPGDEAYTAKSSGGPGGSFEQGNINDIQESGGRRYLKFTTQMSPDERGSPVLNKKGEVIGILVAGPSENESLGFAVPVTHLAGLGLPGLPRDAPEPAPGSGSGGLVAGSSDSLPGGVAGEARGRASTGELPKIVRKSGGVLQGSALRRAQPLYSPLAKAAGISGSVVVEVVVDEAGDVISSRPVSGHPLLKDSATAAARGWKFSPTLLQGEPVKVIGTVTFNFTL